MIAQRQQVVLHGLHHFPGRLAFGKAHVNIALAEVAHIHRDHLGPQSLEPGPQAGDIRISVNLSVNIVRMQDHRLSGIIPGNVGHDFRGSGILLLGPELLLREGRTESQRHAQRQQQGNPFLHGQRLLSQIGRE